MDVIEQNQEEDPTMAMEDGDNAIDDFEDDGENEENASENEEEVEEEKDTEDEDEFMFREGTNPLDLVHNNDSGVQLYQRLLDHQALPNKKRKAPERCNCEGTSSKKARGDDISGVCLADLVEVMDFEPGKRSKKTRSKKRGRQKGSKTKLDEKLSQMLGDANLHYANRRYDMAISVLHEVVRLKPNLPESYHILGLVYRAIGNYEKEMISTLITAYLTQKDSSLWERLFEWSIEQGDIGKANCYISKAITADPKNSRFRIYLARLLAENQDYQNAAAAYEQVYQLCRENVDALKAAAKFYHKCGQVDRSICILEDYLKSTPDGVNATVVDLLGSILMEIKAHDRALLYIEQFQVVGEELPLNLKVKAGICHVHLGNMEMAQKMQASMLS